MAEHPNDAYGLNVADTIGKQTGHRPKNGAVYTALYRLEAKGLLTSKWSECRPTRGGRRKRVFSVKPLEGEI